MRGSLRYWYCGFILKMKNRLTCISKTKKVRWYRSVEDLKTSARNVEYSRGAVYQPFAKTRHTGEQTDSNEAIIELEVL